MNIKFKISLPTKNKILNWRCNLYFHFELRSKKKTKFSRSKLKNKHKDTIKRIEVLEDNFHSLSSSSHYLQ